MHKIKILLILLLCFFDLKAQYNPLEYAPGFPNVTVTPINQLIAFPRARYKPIAIGTDSLLPMFSCMDPIYLGGLSQNQNYYTSAKNGAEINLYLARNFKWVLDAWNIGDGTQSGDTTKLQGMIVRNKKANPKLPLQGVTFITSVADRIPYDSHNYVTDGTFPSSFFLQNSSGCPVNEQGIPCPTCPTFPASGGTGGIGAQARPSSVSKQSLWYPDDTLIVSGNYWKTTMDNFAANLGGNTFYNVWENDELFKRYTNVAMQADPGVAADILSSGPSDPAAYESAWYTRLMTGYKNKYIGTSAASVGTKWTVYSRNGIANFFFYWNYVRPMFYTHRGKKLSTSDFYPTPNFWYNIGGATHGILWMQYAQMGEFAQGDSIQSPFVAHGWNADETQNISPPQWLGLLKTLSLMGSETFYPAQFSLCACSTDPDPKNYIWASVVPSYAQAITSRFEKYLHYGKLLPGDMTSVYTAPYPAFRFDVNDTRVYAVARQIPGINKFVFGGNLNRNSNIAGSTPDSVVKSLTINGNLLTVKFDQHGDVYVFDNTNPAAPVFYQLDYWHEKTHPYYWSTDFLFQAEVNDNYNDVQLKTTRRAGAPAGDFVNATTYISYADTTTVLDTVRFNFTPTVPGTYYFWARLRSRNGTQTGIDIKLNNGSSLSIPCVTDQNFYWYRFNGCVVAGNGMSYSLTAADQHLGILARNKYVEIDQIVLTKTVNAGYPEAPATCTTPSTITPSGTTTFCTGGSVTLTALTNPVYLWSTGETTQSISVTTSGTYTVTVTNGAGCTGVSSGVNVVVNTLPATPTISTSGSTAICAGSTVTLTSSPAASYLWNNASTSPFIVVGTAGSYSVVIADVNGCTAASASTSVTVNALPAVPVITAGGPTTFCNGGSVTLTSTASSTYLWSTGATTQAISATTSGSYRVTVTNASGCTRSSALFSVTVNANPATPIITPTSSTTFCTGSSTSLSCSTAPSYLWSTGQTTQIITSFISSTYTVTVTNAAGCTASSPAITTTLVAGPSTPTISAGGATTFCSGGSVTLTGTAATTYIWSNGATTQAVTVGTSGSYRITVSNTAGCTASSAITPVTVNPKPIIGSITPVQNTCPAVNFDLSTITLVNTGQAITTKTYHTSLSDANNNINPISSVVTSTATYYIRGNAANGCYDVKGVGVTIVSCSCASPPAANAGPDQSICAKGTAQLAGSITNATVGTWTTSGTGTFTPSATTLAAVYTPSAADTVAGTVTLTLTTDNPLGAPCVADANIMILTINRTATITITASGATTFCSGTIRTLTATNVAGATYLWSTGETTQAVNKSTSGTYTCTITNSSGCTGVSNAITLTVNASPSIPTITATGSVMFCAGDSVLLTSTAATSYLWSSGATTQGVYVKVSGNYTVTVTNAAGCTRSSVAFATTAIALPSTPVISCINDSVCQGDSMQLKSSAASGNLWSNGATTQTTYAKTTDTYYVTVTNVSGCTKSSAGKLITIVSPPATPTITAGGSTTFCNGDSIDLASSASVMNVWSNGDTNQVTYAKSSGSYRVKSYNTFGCYSTSLPTVITVNANPSTPVITTNKSPILCYGDSVTLTSNRANGNTWSTGATTKSIVVKLDGTYTVTGTNASGCSKTSAPLIVTVINCDNTCRTPTQLTSGQITRTAVNLRWDSLNVATDYIIYLTNLRTNVVQKKTVQGNTHFIKMKGLDPGTGYNWKVQAVCGRNTFTPFSVVKYFGTKE